METQEKNSAMAFTRSLEAGFGIETDLRDLNGELVISHDPPTFGVMTLADFLTLYKRSGTDLRLALNIKADGLQEPLLTMLAAHGVYNYFVFDMSIPDQLGYMKRAARVFSRQSEYEPTPAAYDDVDGIWLDGFHGDWASEDLLSRHLAAGKAVCLVSPELHGRPHEAFWDTLKTWEAFRSDRLSLCTDFPMKAREFFA